MIGRQSGDSCWKSGIDEPPRKRSLARKSTAL
ncbi:hypothetical protein ABIC37_004598 [Priestia megaterium]